MASSIKPARAKIAFHSTAEHFRFLRKIVQQPLEKRRILESLGGTNIAQRHILREERKAVMAKNIAIAYLDLPKKEKEKWLRMAKRRILYGMPAQSARAMEFAATSYAVVEASGYRQDARQLKQFLLDLHGKAEPEERFKIRQYLVGVNLMGEIYADVERDLLNREFPPSYLEFYLTVLRQRPRLDLIPRLSKTVERIQDPKLKKKLIEILVQWMA